MLKRVFIYTCDVCLEETQKESFGFPNGFVYLPANKERKQLEHRCPKCKTGEKDEIVPKRN
jgi:hypothetical protein